MIKNLKKAFTIIELVIVIAVIAILAAVMIPTYSSLVDKANLSADEQAVKQMNTALAIYTAENGKPSDRIEVKKALDENLINADTLVPVTQGYAFYWNPNANKIVLVGGKVEAENEWVLLTSTGYGELKEVSTATEITNEISNSSTENPVLIKLEENINILENQPSVTTTGYPLNDKGESTDFEVVYSVENDKSVILDLNGKTLTDSSILCTFAVCPGGSLTIKNGTIESDNPRVINTHGGTVSLNNVTIKISNKDNETNKYAIKFGGLCDISIVNCDKIFNPAGFVITSNAANEGSKGSRVAIINSNLESTHSGCSGAYIPTYCSVLIEDSTISGVEQGVYLRGCNATIKNSSIYNTNKDGEFLPCKKNKDGKYINTTWGGGNYGYTADIVFAAGNGGYANTGNYICENVSGDITDSSENNFTVIISQPDGTVVNYSGITINQKFINNELYYGEPIVENAIEKWNPSYN